MWSFGKAKKQNIKSLENDTAVEIKSTKELLELFSFYFNQEIAKRDAKNFAKEMTDAQRISSIYQHCDEDSRIALLCALAETSFWRTKKHWWNV